MRFPAVLLLSTVLAVPAAGAPPQGLAAPTTLPGLLAPVQVFRDAHEVPHIFASTDRDALFVLGRAHGIRPVLRAEVKVLQPILEAREIRRPPPRPASPSPAAPPAASSAA